MAGNIKGNLHLFVHIQVTGCDNLYWVLPFSLWLAVSNKLGWEGLGSRPEPGYASIIMPFKQHTLLYVHYSISAEVCYWIIYQCFIYENTQGGNKSRSEDILGEGGHVYTEQHSKFEELKSPIRGGGTNQTL